MKNVYPDYYNDFNCIADKCKHSCCIGWEIDIDQESLELYQGVKGDFGKRLKENISLEGTPHFVLKENERCPFLNCQNLCDIYKELGKDKLCQICSDHPRFYNELENRTEAGLGLCCEEAARLIITKKYKFKLIGEGEVTDGILLLRDKVFKTLQDRNFDLKERIKNTVALSGTPVPRFDILRWVEVFEGLERLDQSWTKLLAGLKADFSKVDQDAFADFIKQRETEYEQFLCYLVYRHASKAEFLEAFVLYIYFALLCFELIYAMGAVIFTQKGDFTVDDQLNVMRLFSSEIEYSDENLDAVLDELYKEFFNN